MTLVRAMAVRSYFSQPPAELFKHQLLLLLLLLLLPSEMLSDSMPTPLTFFVVTGDWSRRLSFDTVQQHGRAEGK